MALIRSDAFQQADGALNSNWTQGMGASAATPAVVYGGLSASTAASTWIDAAWSATGDSFTNNQFSEIEIRTHDVYNGTAGLGCTVLRTIGGNGYACFWLQSGAAPIGGDTAPGAIYLYTVGSGAFSSSLAGSVSQSCKPGDKMRLVASTNATSGAVTLTVYWNGTQVVTYTDTTYKYKGGSPGVCIWDTTLAQIESWFGGDGDQTTVVTHPTPPIGMTRVPGASYCYNPRMVNSAQCFDVISGTNNNAPNTYGNPTIRFCQPTSPDAGVKHKYLIVLPVADGAPGSAWGDGLDEIVSNNLHNTYNFTLIAPSFTSGGTWGMDSDLNSSWRNESFIVNELMPWIKLNFNPLPSERICLIGFSRSGYAAMNLLIRHPTLFDIIAMWDFPMESVTYDYLDQNYNDVCGSQANFNTYQITPALLDVQGETYRSHYRLVIGENSASDSTFAGAWNADVTAFLPNLTNAGMKYQYVTTTATAHAWNTGWIPEVVPVLAQTADQYRRRFVV